MFILYRMGRNDSIVDKHENNLNSQSHNRHSIKIVLLKTNDKNNNKKTWPSTLCIIPSSNLSLYIGS